MIILGSILMVLSVILVIASDSEEYKTVYTESDFERSSGNTYVIESYDERLGTDFRVTIKDRMDRAVEIRFRVEDDWEEIFDKRGITPEEYYFQRDEGFFLEFPYLDFYLEIEDYDYDIEDLDVDISHMATSDTFFAFCIGGFAVSIFGMILIIMGIIFTVVYSNRLKKLDPEYLREQMLQQQRMMIEEKGMRERREREAELFKRRTLERARNLEKAFRLEEAARTYEGLGLWEDAGRCRRKMRTEVSKEIHVDVNDLFDRIKKEGTSVPYICPGCRGTVDIDGRKKSMTKCPYCGTTLDFEMLQKVVSDLLY
jgi:hypothetical protein